MRVGRSPHNLHWQRPCVRRLEARSDRFTSISPSSSCSEARAFEPVLERRAARCCVQPRRGDQLLDLVDVRCCLASACRLHPVLRACRVLVRDRQHEQYPGEYDSHSQRPVGSDCLYLFSLFVSLRGVVVRLVCCTISTARFVRATTADLRPPQPPTFYPASSCGSSVTSTSSSRIRICVIPSFGSVCITWYRTA